MGIEQREASLPGGRVHYLVTGSGPPLLLLHAIGESSTSWYRVLPGLADRYTVYAPDLPGFGASDPLQPTPPDGPTPARLAAAMAAFLEDVTGTDAGRAVVVGNSLGGLVALELALRHPQAVGRLVLEDSAGLGHYVHPALRAVALPGYGDLAASMARAGLGAGPRAWARIPLLLARPRSAPPQWVEDQRRLATQPHHVLTSLAALRAQVGLWGQRRVLLDALSRIQIPTLVLWGEQDAVFPVSQARAAAARLPAGQLVVVPDCGHLPHLEQPERFLQVIDAVDAT